MTRHCLACGVLESDYHKEDCPILKHYLALPDDEKMDFKSLEWWDEMKKQGSGK
jgi:hypothetical protein